MSYENFMLREMTTGADRWCSQCERTADDCVCEELSDHFNSIEPLDTGGSDTLVQGERDPVSLSVGENPTDADPFRAVCSGDSGEDVRVFPASPEPHRFMGADTESTESRPAQSEQENAGKGEVELSQPPPSFSEWLESHGDYLPLPNSFQEWLDRGNDAI